MRAGFAGCNRIERRQPDDLSGLTQRTKAASLAGCTEAALPTGSAMSGEGEGAAASTGTGSRCVSIRSLTTGSVRTTVCR